MEYAGLSAYHGPLEERRLACAKDLRKGAAGSGANHGSHFHEH